MNNIPYPTMVRLLITGGAGFLGSNFVSYLLEKNPRYRVMVLDLLDRGDVDNFPPSIRENPNFSFYQGDIRDRHLVENLVRNCDMVVHFAAQCRGEKTALDLLSFTKTNMEGTHTLLEVVRKYPVERFIYISSAEVYGDAQTVPITEDHPLLPRNLYGATKAGADRLAWTYYVAYSLPIVILRIFSVFGPYQHPNNIVPRFIINALKDRPLPVSGDGSSSRDWLYVDDCSEVISRVLEVGIEEIKGEILNVGTGVENDLNTVVKIILDLLKKPQRLVKYVEEDNILQARRMVASTAKAKVILNWTYSTDLEEGLERTVEWFVNNRWWWERLEAE